MRTGFGDGPGAEGVPTDVEVVGEMPNANGPCDGDGDENSSAEERRRSRGGRGAVLGRGIACDPARGRAGEGPGTFSVDELVGGLGEFLTNSEEDRGRPRPGGALL